MAFIHTTVLRRRMQVLLFLAFALLLLGAAARSLLPTRRAATPPPLVGAVLQGSGSELGPYEIIHASPVDGQPNAVVVFIPGNPGQPAFYSDFATMLSNRLHAEVVVLGLVGHVTRPSLPLLSARERRRGFTIEEQVMRRTHAPALARVRAPHRPVVSGLTRIHAHRSQVAHTAARSAVYRDRADALGVPLCVMGHSIGAWLVHAPRPPPSTSPVALGLSSASLARHSLSWIPLHLCSWRYHWP